MKLLLYCTKAEPYLIKFGNEYGYNQFDTSYCKNEHVSPYEYGSEILNGFIVAECDYEIEKINYSFYDYTNWFYSTARIDSDLLYRNSCISENKMSEYLRPKLLMRSQDNIGYAIHLTNLHIFDKPKHLTQLTKMNWQENIEACVKRKGFCNFGFSSKGDKWIGCIKAQLDRAPQNMMKVIDWNGENCILISIKSEWLCKILNKEKTIEVRKRVLKEMVSNEQSIL